MAPRSMKPAAIVHRNQPVFMGHAGPSKRRLVGNGRGPVRPTSPCLAVGNGKSSMKDGDDNEGRKQTEKEKADWLEGRCDDLERLVCRKITAKQPLRRTEHSLHECSDCTKSGRDEQRKPLKAPADSKYFFEKQQYKHVQWPHRPNLVKGHEESRARPRVVLPSKELHPDKCAKLSHASTLRSIDDMGGAGRLAASSKRQTGTSKQHRRLHGGVPMALPEQRCTGAAVLRSMMMRYLSYWDLDGSQSFSPEEFGRLFHMLCNGDFHAAPQEYVINGEKWKYQNIVTIERDVLEALMHRYDQDGDSCVTFKDICDRLMLVADSADDRPLPLPAVSRQRRRQPLRQEEQGSSSSFEERAAAMALRRAADQLEVTWVTRLASKTSSAGAIAGASSGNEGGNASRQSLTPSMIAKRLKASLAFFDLEDNGQLEAAQMAKALERQLPGVKPASINTLVQRYIRLSQPPLGDGKGAGDERMANEGAVSVGAAVNRMMRVLEVAAGATPATACSNGLAPDESPGVRHALQERRRRHHPGNSRRLAMAPEELRLLKYEKMEVALSDRLWCRAKSERHTDLRAALRAVMRSFDGGGKLGIGGEQLRQGDTWEDELEYREAFRALRPLFDRGKYSDEDMESFIACHLDRDRNGSVSLEELADRIISGLEKTPKRGIRKSRNKSSPGLGGSTKHERKIGYTDRRSGEYDERLFHEPTAEPPDFHLKRVADLEKALLDKLEKRIRSSTNRVAEGQSTLHKIAKQCILPFARTEHRGIVIAKHEDGKYDIDANVSEGSNEDIMAKNVSNGKALSDLKTRENHRARDTTTFRGVSADCITPEGKWIGTAPRRAWEGDSEPIKVGMLVRFRHAEVLSSQEFRSFVQMLLPHSSPEVMDAEINALSQTLDTNDSGFITVQKFANRMLSLARGRNNEIYPKINETEAKSTQEAKRSVYLQKKRERRRRSTSKENQPRHLRTTFQY